jgi:hypothetical protein
VGIGTSGHLDDYSPPGWTGVSSTVTRFFEHKSKMDDLHFGITRQCPLAIGPISMKAKIVSVSRSFILHSKHHIQSTLPGWGWTYEGISPGCQYISRVGQTFDDFAEDTSEILIPTQLNMTDTHEARDVILPSGWVYA